jgi:hypothetical protein
VTVYASEEDCGRAFPHARAIRSRAEGRVISLGAVTRHSLNAGSERHDGLICCSCQGTFIQA